MSDTSKAELMLAVIFPTCGKAVKYIEPFKTSSGKEFALERKKRASDDLPYYVWMQHEPARLDGVSIQNEKSPGMPYERGQSRTTGLSGKTAPTLMNGNKAYYVRVNNIDVLNELAREYERSPVVGGTSLY
jgi:hypothetical protein